MKGKLHEFDTCNLFSLKNNFLMQAGFVYHKWLATLIRSFKIPIPELSNFIFLLIICHLPGPKNPKTASILVPLRNGINYQPAATIIKVNISQVFPNQSLELHAE